jgi:tetratricopeptide (TPR) repeat protein
VYHAAGAQVDALAIPTGHSAHRDACRLRAYLYLREANALRALGRPAEAAALGSRELDAAMASGDSLSIARAMLSLGGTCLANGEIERGLKFLREAKPMFEHHADAEHRQGLGWWYIVWADIGNAGLVEAEPEAALEAAATALEILRPLENWPGVVRAHAARAKAFERLGDEDSARVARTAEKMAAEQLKRHRQDE